MRKPLEEASARIALIGQVYQRLEHSNDLLEADAVTVVSAIANKAQRSLNRGLIHVHTNAPSISIPVRLSVSLGIIVTELVTNAVKYAFDSAPVVTQEELQITLRLEREEDGMLSVAVADNGKGLEDHVIQGTRRGYGLTIVRALVEQHAGEMELRNDRGAVALVRLAAQDSA